MQAANKRSIRLTWISFCVFAAVAAFYLLTEHRAHLLGWLPYLIFLACPLMHLFMHRSHHHRGADADHATDADSTGAADQTNKPYAH